MKPRDIKVFADSNKEKKKAELHELVHKHIAIYLRDDEVEAYNAMNKYQQEEFCLAVYSELEMSVDEQAYRAIGFIEGMKAVSGKIKEDKK